MVLYSAGAYDPEPVVLGKSVRGPGNTEPIPVIGDVGLSSRLEE
jgi:hypothetical protein